MPLIQEILDAGISNLFSKQTGRAIGRDDPVAVDAVALLIQTQGVDAIGTKQRSVIQAGEGVAFHPQGHRQQFANAAQIQVGIGMFRHDVAMVDRNSSHAAGTKILPDRIGQNDWNIAFVQCLSYRMSHTGSAHDQHSTWGRCCQTQLFHHSLGGQAL